MVAVVLGVGSVPVFAGTMQSTVGIDHAMQRRVIIKTMRVGMKHDYIVQ